jgi:hypothetical protein
MITRICEVATTACRGMLLGVSVAAAAAAETQSRCAGREDDRYLSDLLRVQSSTLRSLKREKSFTFAVTSIKSLTWAMAAI